MQAQKLDIKTKKIGLECKLFTFKAKNYIFFWFKFGSIIIWCNRYLTYDINFIGEKFLTSSNGSIG